MEVESREGRSVYLRGYGDYLRYSLKLTEAPATGLGHVAFRTWSEEALARRVAAIERSGLGAGWVEGDVAPKHLRPSLKNQPQRYTGRGAAVKRLDHVNVLAEDVAANSRFAEEVLGYRLHEKVQLDDGSESGAWLSASIAAHELIYTVDAHRARGRLHHLAFWVDTREEVLRAADLFLDSDVHIEFAPSKHAIAQGFFLYGYEPAGNR